MPFTIVTDEMVAVNPGQDYVRIIVEQEEWLVGQDRLEGLMKDLQISEILKSRCYKREI